MSMKWVPILWLAGCICLSAATAPVINDPVAGKDIAAKLAAAAPEENASFRGVFELERPKVEDALVPVTTAILLTNQGWARVYTGQTDRGLEKLSIVNRQGKPAVYTYEPPGKEPISIVGDRATNSFAGSDFSLIDLGLEFFHWPTQVLLTKEMRKGRGCYVLESRPANPVFYSRVVSWIDQESFDNGVPGLLMAEAYDSEGKLLKQFEVRHFKKVSGQWQVQEMELRNRQTKGSTRLRFQFDTK